MALAVGRGSGGRSVLTDHLVAPNTARAYRSDLGYFWAWAELAARARRAYPVRPELVSAFVRQHLEGLPDDVDEQLLAAGVKRKAGPLKVATVERRVAALRSHHRRQGLPEPIDREVLDLLRAGRRERAANGGQAKKRALTRPLLERLLGTCDSSLEGLRDAALLLVGWASGGRRRSELAAIEVSHLHLEGDDYTLLVARSKTDQEGTGATVPVAGRAASALGRWLAASGIDDGPVFRVVAGDEVGGAIAPDIVARVVKRRAELAGLEPTDFGAHSLRSGFLTQCGRDGVPLAEAMKMSLHRDVTVAMGYHEAGAALKNPAARLAG